MRTHRFAILAATTTLGLVGLTSALPAHASQLPSPTDCLHVQGGSGSYIGTYTPAKKKKDPAILVSATAHFTFELGTDPTETTKTASCLGATYTLHVKNYDGKTQQDSSQSLDYQGFTATPNTGTATVIDPSQVDVSWAGDGTTTDFSASVTTGPNDTSSCIDGWITTSFAGQPTAQTNHLVLCFGSSGGNTYFG